MKYYRLMTLLPAPPAAPDRPTVPLAAGIELLRGELSPAHWTLAEAMLTRLDVANTEALLQGRAELVDGRALRVTSAERLAALRARGELPDFFGQFLEHHEQGTLEQGGYSFDRLWQGYYGWLQAQAERGGSRFLREWVSWEISLLDRLARWRGGRLGRSGDAALLSDLGTAAGHEELIGRLAEEDDPQRREMLLDGARLAAIERSSGSDPFALDAVLAWLAAALLLDRWELPREADPPGMLEAWN